MWFLPTCDNVQVVDSFNKKYTLYLESRKEYEAYMKKQNEYLAKSIRRSNIMMICGIY